MFRVPPTDEYLQQLRDRLARRPAAHVVAGVEAADSPDDVASEGIAGADDLAAPEPTGYSEPADQGPRLPARTKRKSVDIIEGSVVEFIIERAPTSGEAAGFTRLPNLLIHGEIGARLERLAAGTAWLVVVLLRYAERRDHVMKASKATLCRLAGIRKTETLDRRLRLLTRTHKRLELPALLRKLPGTDVCYAFRWDGLATLIAQARRAVDQQALRLAAIRKAQSDGGRKGMRTRWGGRAKSSPASRGTSYESPGQTRAGITRPPDRKGRE